MTVDQWISIVALAIVAAVYLLLWLHVMAARRRAVQAKQPYARQVPPRPSPPAPAPPHAGFVPPAPTAMTRAGHLDPMRFVPPRRSHAMPPARPMPPPAVRGFGAFPRATPAPTAAPRDDSTDFAMGALLLAGLNTGSSPAVACLRSDPDPERFSSGGGGSYAGGGASSSWEAGSSSSESSSSSSGDGGSSSSSSSND